MTLDKLNNHSLPLDPQVQTNLQNLCDLLTRLEGIYGKEFVITSGYRSPEIQMKVDPNHPNSAHCTGEACDIEDSDQSLWHYLIENAHYLEELGLYMEALAYSPNHRHLQTKPTKERIFLP